MSSISQTIGGEHEGEKVPISRIAGASCVGTIIEAYDFVLYGAVAALVFDELFFPNANPTVGTLAAFATFGVGFLARPVGGVLFGHWGDRVGRKSMLIFTLLMMGAATILIGCLPATPRSASSPRSCSSRCGSSRAWRSAASGAAPC